MIFWNEFHQFGWFWLSLWHKDDLLCIRLDWQWNYYFWCKLAIFDFQKLQYSNIHDNSDNNLYITCDYKIFKTDKYLNITSQYNNPAALYRGLYYNSLNNTIYVAGSSSYSIDVFDLNLVRVDSIPTSTYSPHSLQEFEN